MLTAQKKRLQNAYNTWLDAQRQAVEIMLASDYPASPIDWAEGARWVGRMSSNALDQVIEKNDPLYPTLYVSQDEFRKFMVDNPDTRYQFAVLDETQTYHLHGTIGEAPHVSFTLGTNIFNWGSGEAMGGTLGHYDLGAFDVGADGHFELWISPQKREGNWIPMPQGAGHLTIRETFFDKAGTSSSDLLLDRIGDALPAPWAQADSIADKLEIASRFLLFTVNTVSMVSSKTSQLPPNVIMGNRTQTQVGDWDDDVLTHTPADIFYMAGHFQLQEDQALKITVRPPKGEFVYWGLMISNPWQESFDYRYTTTHWNNGTANQNEDGTWTLVVSPRDTGAGNWIDTGGRMKGFITMRWLLKGDQPPDPLCEVFNARRAVEPDASLRDYR
jgi:uncharacterized protein DUF1214